MNIDGLDSEAVERIGTGRKAQFYNIVPLKRNDISTITSLSYDLDDLDWLEYLKHFIYIRTSVDDYEEKLRQQLSDVDMEISDIMHCVELRQLTDEQSLNIVDCLRDCRERRRQVKDRMYEVDWYKKAFENIGIVNKVKESVKQINLLEKRTYKPRKLSVLFDESMSAEKPLVREEKREETPVMMETMAREKRKTIYDGKKNDWLEFAKSQMLFFGDARQYIINLELDMEQIDREIEDILLQIEGASCNVTQGYKVFKRLKDLRVERREKENEWKCLQVLVNEFDCVSLEDSFRYSRG